MFGVEPEASPAEPEASPRQRLGEWLRRMPTAQVLMAGVPLLGSAIVLQLWGASESLTCRREGATTSCVATRHVALGLVPAGTSTLEDVRGARVVVTRTTGRSPGQSRFYVTVDTAAGEYRMQGTSGLEEAYEAANMMHEAILTKAVRFDVSPGFVLIDALLRLVTFVMCLVGAGLTAFGLVRLAFPRRFHGETDRR